MRAILHVDMDAFYASVEQLDAPSLRGKPVIVGADPRDGKGRGVVAACSYEARTFGVHSAQPISQAWRLCPHGVYVRPRMERYVEVSRQVMEILHGVTDLVEPLSIDEAFLDVTGSQTLRGHASVIARGIKDEIRGRLGLTASVGGGPNKYVAKVASDIRKPDGLVCVEPDEVQNFLRDLPVSRLWGVGAKTGERLQRLGLHRISDVAATPLHDLRRELGALGEHIFELAHGRDDRPVVPNAEPKSVSAETTFDEDTANTEILVRTLRELSDHVAERLRRHGFRARRVTLKLRYSDFSTFTRQTTLDMPTQTAAELAPVVIALLAKFEAGRSVRLLGVGTSEFTSADPTEGQLALFSPASRNETVEHTMDAIRQRFGRDKIRRGPSRA